MDQKFQKTTTLRPNIPETKARARYHQIKTLSYAETKSGAYRMKRISEVLQQVLRSENRTVTSQSSVPIYEARVDSQSYC